MPSENQSKFEKQGIRIIKLKEKMKMSFFPEILSSFFALRQCQRMIFNQTSIFALILGKPDSSLQQADF